MSDSKKSSSIDLTLSFLSDLKHVHTIGELTEAVRRATQCYGVERILSGFMPKAGALPSEQMRNILIADWPEQWTAIYFKNGLIFQDPTIRRVLRSEPSFAWSDFSKTLNITNEEKRVMDKAKDFYLGNGYTVPLVSLDGRYAGFSFAGSDIDVSPEARGAMTLIATFAFGRAVELHNDINRTTLRLTPRERDVIGWIAAGKTDWEISVIFGVSEKAIAKHIYNIRIKLGAANRAHAVAEALRQKLIS